MRSQKLYYVHLHLTSITKEKRERLGQLTSRPSPGAYPQGSTLIRWGLPAASSLPPAP